MAKRKQRKGEKRGRHPERKTGSGKEKQIN